MSDERGASLALVALSLVWLVGMAALVVDVGDGWLGRRTLISATDAASLAAAQDLVDRPWDENGACATAEAYVVDNAATAAVVDCTSSAIGSDAGRITVSASDELDAVLVDPDPGGAQEGSVGSVSTVAWGPPATVTALRPFALCHDGSASLRQLIDDPPSGPTWVEVHFTKDDPSACGGPSSAGNFATIDFESGTGTQQIRNWMLHGYRGQIGFDPPTTVGCGPGVTCYERPYASDAIRPELQLLRSRGSYVLFPVFDFADVERVHLIGMVRARLYDFQLDGPPETWWVELKVDPGLVAGICCGPPAVLAGNKVIAICGVDPATYGTCEAAVG